MPHSVHALRQLVKRGLPLAALAALSCARRGELRLVLANPTAAPGAVEVLAIPADSAPSLPPDPARRTADSLASYYRLARRRLNLRAESLSHADRRTASYAAAYGGYGRARADAEALRATRDSAIRLLPPVRPIDKTVLARATHGTISNAAATLELAPGRWWIGIVDARGVLVRAPQEVRIEAGESVQLTIVR